MKHKGKIVKWNDKKGFGFIEPIGNGPRAFIHISAFKNRARRPVDGDVLFYHCNKDSKGKYKATEATLSDTAGKRRSPSKTATRPAISIVLLFFGLLASLVIMAAIPWEAPFYYGGCSLIAYVVYTLDKSAARKGNWRIPEAHLHLIALIGGWPGALLAQRQLRHKSSKTSFLIMYWITVVINISALVWLFSRAQ